LQQVGAKSFANAQPVDLLHLPVPISRSGRRALVKANHVWVLHKQLIVRAVGAILALLFVVGTFETRDAIGSVGVTIYRFVQGEFAEAGFGIDAIEITGQTLTDDKDIITLLSAPAIRLSPSTPRRRRGVSSGCARYNPRRCARSTRTRSSSRSSRRCRWRAGASATPPG
jgi:hypothetical protein